MDFVSLVVVVLVRVAGVGPPLIVSVFLIGIRVTRKGGMRNADNTPGAKKVKFWSSYLAAGAVVFMNFYFTKLSSSFF